MAYAPSERPASTGSSIHTSFRHEVLAAHFAFGIALAAIAIYITWRRPLGATPGLEFLGLSAFLSFMPIVLGWTLGLRWSYGLRLLALLLIVLGLGWLAGRVPAAASARWLIQGAGWLAWVAVLVRAARRSPRVLPAAAATLGVALVFGVWTTLECYTRDGYLSPLFVELIDFGFLPHRDTLYFLSLSNMTRFYGVPSTGLQGTPYVPYHNAAYVVLAWLASLMRVDTFTAFIVGFPALLVPLYQGTLLRCVLLLQRVLGVVRLWPAFAAAGLVCLCTIGLFSGVVELNAGIWHGDVQSASDAFGLFVFFAAMEIGMAYAVVAFSGVASPRAAEKAAVVVVAAALAAAMTYAKGAVGVVYVAMVTVLIWRAGVWRRPLAWLLGGATVAGHLTADWFLMSHHRVETWAWQFGHFFVTYVKVEWPLYVFLSLMWANGAFIALWVLSRRGSTPARSVALLAEALLWLVVIAMAPGLTLVLQAGAADYFSNVAIIGGTMVFAAAAPLAWLVDVPAWRRPLPVSWTLGALAVWVLAVGAALNLHAQLTERRAGRAAEWKVLNSGAPKVPAMALLDRLTALPLPRDRVLVNIPASYDAYWKLTECVGAPLVLPAVTGFAFLDGRPDASCGARAILGHASYPPRVIAREDPAVPVCARRPSAKFRYVVSPTPDARDWSIVDCEVPAAH